MSVAEDVLKAAIALRHDLHRHPELGYEEYRTADRIRAWLEEDGIPYRSGLAKGTGIVAELPATVDPGRARTVALRADMDALPIRETTGLPYESAIPGKMHACGHDGHVAVLCAAARTFARRKERLQNVRFVFQPAEEGGAGGRAMVHDGAVDGVSAVYGLHGFPALEVGEASTRVGPLMASAAQFFITIHGRGAHAAYPHVGIDPIMVGSLIVASLQTVVSRVTDPLQPVVVTVGQFHAGVAHNVIPARAELHGTLRTLDDATEARARNAIERTARNTALAHGAEATIEWRTSYPAVVNDAAAVSRVRQVGSGLLGERMREEQYPSMGGEDFSFYRQVAPASCFFFLGIRPVGQESYPNLHASDFDFNDAAIPAGVGMFVGLAENG